ncbi:MAG TPA: RNA pyrophosphohydrolase [Methyloceanibacter sp.]|jgi:putative (di)nucleoside polyphosphate hydrolase|nr:RNA pyrophosphohydrolase [Methyloceanibacter sp.]
MTMTNDLPYRPCVGVMLINRQGHVFVGRRADRSGAPEGVGQWWQMPQGGLDEGEDPEDAARRELEEETGVTRARIIGRSRQWHNYDLPQGLVGTAWHGRYRGQSQLWFAARFEGEDSEIDLSPKRGHEREFDAWKWVPHVQLPELVVPFKRPVYEGVIQEFERFVLGTP